MIEKIIDIIQVSDCYLCTYKKRREIRMKDAEKDPVLAGQDTEKDYHVELTYFDMNTDDLSFKKSTDYFLNIEYFRPKDFDDSPIKMKGEEIIPWKNITRISYSDKLIKPACKDYSTIIYLYYNNDNIICLDFHNNIKRKADWFLTFIRDRLANIKEN
ncbi:MAG TPA: hypothetical protein ENG89_00575 [Candidatus Moranbacteria bacterium]|nr:hypothetical protein [Candidatus Moranbacteria bacterium]